MVPFLKFIIDLPALLLVSAEVDGACALISYVTFINLCMRSMCTTHAIGQDRGFQHPLLKAFIPFLEISWGKTYVYCYVRIFPSRLL